MNEDLSKELKRIAQGGIEYMSDVLEISGEDALSLAIIHASALLYFQEQGQAFLQVDTNGVAIGEIKSMVQWLKDMNFVRSDEYEEAQEFWKTDVKVASE